MAPHTLNSPNPDPLPPGALGGGPAEAGSGDALPGPMRGRLDEAFVLAHRRLARRDHTHIQLRDRLRRAGFDDAVVSEVLATLVGQGYIDDERFARRFIEDRRNLDGWGEPKIRRALRSVGVADATVADELHACEPAHDELAAAISLLASRLRMPPYDERSRAAALGLLLRRGYDSDLAYDAVRAFERG